MATPSSLDRENRIVLSAVQALLGLVSRNIIAVAVHLSDEHVTLRFWVHARTDETDEDISDTLAEMESFADRSDPASRSELYVGQPPKDWHTWAGRMIFWSKE
jgi:hypothetical protein